LCKPALDDASCGAELAEKIAAVEQVQMALEIDALHFCP
jgi:hypothetical protein